MSATPVPNLTPRAKRLLRLLACGQTISEAAMQTSYCISRASIIANSELGKDYILMLEQDSKSALMVENARIELDFKAAALERIKEEIPESLDRLCELRDGAPPAVMLGATVRLLDMAGLTVKQHVEMESKVVADAGVMEAMNRLATALAAKPVPSAPTEASGL